jgi:hypothetical protein
MERDKWINYTMVSASMMPGTKRSSGVVYRHIPAYFEDWFTEEAQQLSVVFQSIIFCTTLYTFFLLHNRKPILTGVTPC